MDLAGDVHAPAEVRRAARGVSVLLTVAGAAAVCYFTLFPFDFVLRRDSFAATVGAFTLMTGFPLSPRELPANTLLFVPLGAGAAAWLRAHRAHHPVLWACLIGSVVSSCLELTQSAWLLRDPALDDILGNTLGALSGASLAVHLLGRRRRLTPMAPAQGWRVTTLVVVSLWTLLGVGGLVRSAGDTRLDQWDASYPLVVGNEATGDVPWLGSIRYLAIADRAVGKSDRDAVLGGQALGERVGSAVVLEQVFTGPREVPSGWERRGAVEPAASPPAPGGDPGAVLDRAFWLVRPDVRSVVQRVRTTQAFTVAVTARSDRLPQTGPARLVTLSVDTLHRDVAVTQDGADLVVRVRSDFSGPNGRLPEFVYPGVFSSPGWHRIVVTYDVTGITVGVDDPARTRRLGFVPATVTAVESFPDRLQRIQLSGVSARAIAAFVALGTYGPLAAWLGALGPRRRATAVLLATGVVALLQVAAATALPPAGWRWAWTFTVAVGAGATCVAVRILVGGLTMRPAHAAR